MSQNQETRGFQSEVKQLLQLMIHSLYSNKEIFLRELISNASDAADKLRFKALSNPALYEGDGDLRVRVSFDADKGTITISDNGIGMTREQVIDHLGTIAKSGTKEFLTALGQDQAKNSQLIGQFGVGFYSAFIVADKVTVKTRAAGEEADKAVLWEECGEKWEKINKSDALWTRSKNDVSDEEYKAFYKHLSHDFVDPVTWAHNKVEGNQAYTSLLYVPAKAPWDLFNREHKHGLKLYVQRVFIMDDAEQFMPNYLRFMRGLIDSNDLPLLRHIMMVASKLSL